ncbi:MAG: hypothetical protein AAFP84_22380 [Actinomycetota bacterium]
MTYAVEPPRDASVQLSSAISMTDDGDVEIRTKRGTISGTPDHDAGAQWLRTLRRVDSVVFDADSAERSTFIVGVGHRRPVRRHVSLETALGLAAAGIPAIVIVRPRPKS